MDPADVEFPDIHDLAGGSSEPAIVDRKLGPDDDDAADWLEEVVARLEADPEECWPAIESLSAVDEETRSQVIAALAAYRERPAIRELLRLLGSAPEPSVRTAAAAVLPQGSASAPAIASGRGGRDLARARDLLAGRVVRSLVTAVDGEGRGTVVISARDGPYRRTAAFRTDVRRGILDAIGEVEPEGLSAGRLVDEWSEQAAGGYALDVPALALSLLAGSVSLSGSEVPTRVRTWLEATIGPEALIVGLRSAVPGPEFEAIPDEEMPARANLILDACPDWLDRSALTFEMAAEIALREGDGRPDPARDAGAYRYLFEHRLIDRLDTFARMLLWMGWVWHASEHVELARSAFALAGQLSDEQYAVPSHPFTVALATRSLRAAQEGLITGDGRGAALPRRPHP
jgi:hypothetical protein